MGETSEMDPRELRRPGQTRPGQAPALEARDLTLSWDGESIVAEGVSLRVMPGETVCVVGRSGCGKTTLLHTLAGLAVPRRGRVLLHGEDVTGRPGGVSYMLQKDLLLPHRRVIDNVCLPLTLAGTSREQAREQARALLGRFGLSGTEECWPAELSGGMRQRAAFLRTYLMGNDVVLLDEPFSALDALTRADLRSWYAQMSRELGLATVAITHDVDEAAQMASRTYVLGGSPASVVAEVASSGDGAACTGSPNYEEIRRQILGHLGVCLR